MASTRVPLSSVLLSPQLLAATSEGGSNATFKVLDALGVNNATVYAASTGAGTLTSPYSFIPGSFIMRGFVVEGIYTFQVQGYTQQVYVGGGSTSSIPPIVHDVFQDPATTVQNYSWAQINSVASTNVSQTIKFVRIVPRYAKTAAKIVSISGGTAAA